MTKREIVHLLFIILNSLFIPLLIFVFSRSPINISFYIFQVILLIIIFIYTETHLKSIKIKIKFTDILKLQDYILLINLLLLFYILFEKTGNIIVILTSIFIVYFLPGFITLKLLRFTYYYTWIEWPVLSFALSLGISPLIALPIITLNIPLATKVTFILITYSLLFFTYFTWKYFKDRREKSKIGNILEVYLLDTGIIIWILLFFFNIIFSLYPNMSYLLGLDIVRHYSSSLLLVMAPDSYSSNYPGFHLLEALVLMLANPSLELFQTCMACLSIFSIFSFYILAKAYLKSFNKLIHLFALITFTTSAGLGWIYFLYKKLTTDIDHISLLRSANDVTFWDVGYGQSTWLWFWFRPMTIGFSLFFILLYLITRTDISKRAYLVIFTLLIFALGINHIPELSFFILFFFIFLLFDQNYADIRVKDSVLGSLLGVLFYTIFMITFHRMFRYTEISFTNLLLINFITFSYYIVIFSHKYFSIKKINLPMKMQRSLSLIIFILSCISMGGLIEWFFLSLSNSFSSYKLVYEIYYVPVMMYPVLLGIPLFFALFSIYEIFIKGITLPMSIIVRLRIIILLLIFTIFFGKLLSFINIYYMDTMYHERRFLPIIWMSISILSSISMTKLSIIKVKWIKPLVGIILTLSILSTILSVEYWLIVPYPRLNIKVLGGVGWLSLPQSRDLGTPILTFMTGFSYYYSEFIPSAYRINVYRYPIWQSIYPEVPLTLLYYNERCSPPYVFITSDDIVLVKRLSNSFFANYMIKTLPIVYNDSYVIVYSIPAGVPPSMYSQVIVVNKLRESNFSNLIYTVLSLGGYNYTTCLLDDEKMIKFAETLIISEDSSDFYLNFINWLKNSSAKRFLIFNPNGYGPFSNLMFSEIHSNEYILALFVESTLFNYTLPNERYIKALLIKPREQSKVLAWYSNGNNKTPFITEMNKGNYSIIYVNIFPLVNSYNGTLTLYVFTLMNEIFRHILADLPKAVNVCGSPLAPTSRTVEKLAFFKSAAIEGDVVIKPISVGALKLPSLSNILINIDNQRSITLANITSVNIHDYEIIEIHTKNMTFCTGIGFYTCLRIKDPIIYLSGESSIGLLINKMKEEVTIKGGKSLRIHIFNEVHLYVRNPRIKANGVAWFNGMHSIFSLYPRLMCSNHNLRVSGSMEFQVLVSDVYTFITGFTWSGKIIRDPPRLVFDEYNSLKRVLSYSLIVFIISSSVHYLIKYFKKLRNAG